jgi:hypothetical protein
VNRKYNSKVEDIDSSRKARKVFKDRKAVLAKIIKKLQNLVQEKNEDEKRDEVRWLLIS